MTDGLAASVFGSTARPPWSYSCQEGPSHRGHGDKGSHSCPHLTPGEAVPWEELTQVGLVWYLEVSGERSQENLESKPKPLP